MLTIAGGIVLAVGIIVIGLGVVGWTWEKLGG